MRQQQQPHLQGSRWSQPAATARRKPRLPGFPGFVRLVAAARAVVEERDQTNSDAEVNPQECKVKAHGVGPKLHVAFQHEPEPIGVLPDLSANDSREQWETEWAVETLEGDRRGQRS